MDAIGNSTGLDLSGATCVKIVATRDSVAAGDDIDAPHERQFSFNASTSVAQAIDQIVHSGYLAGVQGGATWSVVAGVPLAVVAQAWARCRAVRGEPQKLTSLNIGGGCIRLHFSYHAQLDPKIVFEVLDRLKLCAP